MSSQFLQATFDGGLRAPHYFNGRLLTADELQTDQRAVLAHQNWLGQASGYGVIDGLVVTQPDKTMTTINISAGSGLNRQGQLIRLPNDMSIALTQQSSSQQPVNDTGRFVVCGSTSTLSTGGTTSIVIDTGAYLLTALPASQFDGQAPTLFTVTNGTQNGTDGTASSGNGQWEVEGIQFKIIRLADFDKVDGVNDKNRCNLLAHWCYGSASLPGLKLDPFHVFDTAGGLDQLDPADLTPCDLPLAVFYWTGAALGFVDVWPARRRLIRPDALIDIPEKPASKPSVFYSWKGLLSDRLLATGQARFLQFQDQVQQLIDRGAGRVAMKDFFRFLPPVGFLPVTLKSFDTIGGFLDELRQSPSDPFINELRSLVRARLTKATQSRVDGASNFDYATFFGSMKFFPIRSMLNDFVMTVRMEDLSVINSQPIHGSFSDFSSLDPSQLWYFDNGYIITNSPSRGYVLTAPSNKGGKLTVSKRNTPPTQDQQWWSMDTDGHLICAANGYVVDIFGGSTASDAALAVWTKNIPSSSNQQWRLPVLDVNWSIVDSAEIASLLQQSWYDDAIDITQFPAPMLNMYIDRAMLINSSAQPCVVFSRARFPGVQSRSII